MTNENENTDSEVKRKLASVQKITKLSPIEGADRIEVADVLGWKVIVKKGEFQVGDLCVYFEVDSILPRTPWSEFLVDIHRPERAIRLKTVKMRKQVSQGLAIPLAATGLENVSEGDDVTEALGVKQYELDIPAELQGLVRGNFPSFLKKTDTHRIQAYPEVIQEMQGRECYVTIKVDGTSSTFYNRFDPSVELEQNRFGVCSRNLDLKETEENSYWKMARKYKLEEKLEGMDVAIQAETYGLGIQKNKLGSIVVDIQVFDIFNIRKFAYVDFKDLIGICNSFDLPMVEVIYVGDFKWTSVDELVEFASVQDYPNGNPAEGIVIRPIVEAHSEALSGRMAIKAISPHFLLKYGE